MERYHTGSASVTLVVEISHKATECNSETTRGFTKNLLQQMGLHIHPAEDGRLCCRQGLPETAPPLTLNSLHSPSRRRWQHMLSSGPTSFLVQTPSAGRGIQQFQRKLVKGRTSFTTGSDFWMTDSFNRKRHEALRQDKS